VTYHDLYKERFDPVLECGEPARDSGLPEAVAAYCREIAAAGGIIIVHPNWWGQPPAIWKQCMFGLCGVDTVYRQMFNVVVTSSAHQRRGWLAEVQAAIGRFFPAIS
jgi:putative NADPH-quinone reductase